MGLMARRADFTFTFVFEMYYDKNKVNKDLVVVQAQSFPLNISRHLIIIVEQLLILTNQVISILLI